MKAKNLLFVLLSLLYINVNAQNTVVVYDGEKTGGATTIQQNWNMVGYEAIWNDRISYIHIPKGFEIRIYEHNNYKGKSIILSKSVFFKDTLKEWNNQISSIKLLSKPKGYTMYYTTYYNRGAKWYRMDDIVLSSAGVMYYGTRVINNPLVQGKTVIWNKDNRNPFDANLQVDGKSIMGNIEHPFYGAVAIKGVLFETVYNTNPPFSSLRQSPKPKVVQKLVTKKEIVEVPTPVPGNNSNTTPVYTYPVRNIKIYNTDNFTGESKIISGSFSPKSFEDIRRWSGKINSIRVPEGWSVRAYRFTNYGGSYLELSDNWSAKNNPEWKNRISSIKIIHKAPTEGKYPLKHNRLRNIKIYTTNNFTGESKIIKSDWSPTEYDDLRKWSGKINSIKIPEGYSIRVYQFSSHIGSYLELSDDWTSKNNPKWKDKISSIKIIHRPN